MKALKAAVLALPLVVACASMPEMIPMEPSVQRSMERVIGRHDLYVLADAELSEEARDLALDQSAGAYTLTALPQVSGQALQQAMAPVMDRHDAYVQADPELDELERDIYLGSTASLRRLFASVPSPVE